MKVWGILLSAVGSLFTAIGLLMQKIANKRVSRDPVNQPSLCLQPIYLVGCVFVFAGLVSNTLMVGMIPMVSIAVLSSQAFVYTTVLETVFIRDGSCYVLSIAYSLSSYLIICIIISHTPYHHISYSVSSYPILRIIVISTAKETKVWEGSRNPAGFCKDGFNQVSLFVYSNRKEPIDTNRSVSSIREDRYRSYHIYMPTVYKAFTHPD